MSTGMELFAWLEGRANSRELLLLAVTIALALIFAFTLPGFATASNWLALLKSIAVLGILSIAAAIVIIGGGIDLSSVAVMIAGVGWLLQLTTDGVDISVAILLSFGLVVAIGLINGVLVSFLEITPLLATLASAFVVTGFTKMALMSQSVVYTPGVLEPYRIISSGKVLGIPAPILILLGTALVAHFLLTRTRTGLFVQSLGDNPYAAVIIGIKRRAITLQLYIISAAIAFLAGLLTAASAGGINVQVTNGTLMFDVILVAVLGGASLSGGQGRISGILTSALLIGIVINGMTLMNVNNIIQDIFKSVVLLLAILLDRMLHPIDPDTARQGDL